MRAGGRAHRARRAGSPGHCRGSRTPSPSRSWMARSCPAREALVVGGLPGVEAGARPTAHGALTIHMPSKGTWAWNSDTMSCHQSRAAGLVKSGKTVNPGHTWRKGQRGDQAPQSHGLARLPGGGRAAEVVGAAGHSAEASLSDTGPRTGSHTPTPPATSLPPAGTPCPLVVGTPWTGSWGLCWVPPGRAWEPRLGDLGDEETLAQSPPPHGRILSGIPVRSPRHLQL